jgi:hypothetical protein
VVLREHQVVQVQMEQAVLREHQVQAV